MSLFGKSGYHLRPIEDVLHDIGHALEYTEVNNFMVVDNLFAGDQEYTEELLHQIAAKFEERALKPRFTVLCRVDQFVGNNRVLSEDFLALMRKAGITHISLGLESVCDSSLRGMKKNSNTMLYIECAKRLHTYGFHIAATFVSGYGYESREDVLRIADFAKSIGCFTIQIYCFSITPKTIDAGRDPHLIIPIKPSCYWNGHSVQTFPRRMLPSILQKATFDSALLFYDRKEPQKRLVRRVYKQIWHEFRPYYETLQRIEENILLPERLYLPGSDYNHVLQEERLRKLVEDEERFRHFSARLQKIFDSTCAEQQSSVKQYGK